MAAEGDNEIEIKLRVESLPAIRRRLGDLGARGGPRVHEVNILFDSPENSFFSRGMLLRLRVERPARRGQAGNRKLPRRELIDSWMFPPKGLQPVIVTWKAPASAPPGAGQNERDQRLAAYKVRREIEFSATDSRAIREVLMALGLGPAFYYEKIRTTHRLPRVPHVIVTIDETPVGVFLELEGRPAAIDRARRALGYGASDAILLSYGALYREHCEARGVPVRDMLFE